MPLKCFNKPNRSEPRPFDALDAAKIMCRVVRAGGSKAQIEAHYKRICVDAPEKRTSEALEAMEAAMQAIEANNVNLNEAFQIFQIVNGILNAIALLGLIIPVARPLRLVAVAARVTVQTRMTSITSQIASNDATFVILQQAAANEARFLQVVGLR